MRTKNFNLKKKIAFIASVTMIATTAAYLPAEVAQNIGIGSGIVAEAAYTNSEVSVGSITQEAVVNLFKAYVKVNGKYLGHDGKLYSTLSAVPTGIEAETVNGKVAGYLGKNVNTDTFNDYFTVNKTTAGTTDTYTLPADTAVGATVSIEVVANSTTSTSGTDKAGAVASSISSVDVTLDDHGVAVVPKQTKDIEVKGDSYSKSDAGEERGDYEKVNFTGLKFVVASPVEAIGSSGTKNKSAALSAAPAVVADATSTPNITTKNTDLVSTDITDADKKNWTYALTKSGSVYAVNLKAELNETVKPNQSVTVDLKLNGNWTATGTNVSQGKLTLTMGSNGKAVSDLITITRDNDSTKKEYYIITLTNKAGSIESKESDFKITADNSTSASTYAAFDTTNGVDLAVAAGNAKATKETITESINGSNQFVTVYTIATNSTDTNQVKINVGTTTGTVDFAENITATSANKKYNDNISITGTWNNSNWTSGKTISITTPRNAGANYETPVLKYTNSTDSYFKLVFTDEYEIKLDNDNDDDPSDDGTTTVKGTTVTKPADVSKGGYTFAGWKIGANAIFTTAGGNLQQSTTGVTPNATLKADYTANKFNLTYDANGGYFDNSTGYTKVAENDDKKATVMQKEFTSGSDTTALTALTSSVTKKTGFTFVGWSTDADATEKMTDEEYEAARPTTANGSLTLYAVWEANKITPTYSTFALDSKGQTTNGTAVADYTATSNAAFKSNAVAGAKFTAGEAFGTLPTPEMKGYTFDGWYRKVTDSTTGKVSASKVTAATVLDTSYLDSDTTITLYAKFKQNSYSVTTDLDGGVLLAAAGGEEIDGIASYKINQYKAANSKVEFYDKDGLYITDAVANYVAQKGSGSFDEFQGWSINGAKAITEGSGLAKAVEAVDKATNITLKAVYDQNATNQGAIYLNTNGGAFYGPAKGATAYPDTSATTPTSLYEKKTFSGDKQATDSYVSDYYTVKDNTVTYGGDKYTIARAGYKFKGWFADEACTQPFDFANAKYPDETETTVYAGWTANTDARYKLNYTLINDKGAEVYIKDKAEANTGDDKSEFKYTVTYMGTSGSVVSAADKTFEYDGVTYVFDEALSTNATYEDELVSVFKDVKDTTSNSKDEREGLSAGKFEIDSDKYTVIQGYFVQKGSESKTLGTATNVAVKDGTVTWTAADNADHYRIQKTVNGKTYYGAKVTAAKATYTVPVEEHEIAVVAYNADESEKTVSTVVKVAASTKLGKATNVKCAEDGTVTFSAATGATKYQVAKVVNGKTYYSAKSDATSIKISPATEDFEVYVIAFDSTGKLSTHSDTIKVSAAASTLEAVDDATITVDGEGKVTWTAAKGAVAYKVFKITKNSEGKEVTNWGSKVTTTSYTFKDLPTTDYKVYVAAIDANGKVKYSAKKKISTLPAATNVKLSADKKTVSWTAPTGTNADKIVKYQVAKFDTAANKTAYSVKVDAPATSITMKNAAVAGTKIFVLAFDADGNSSYSASIDVK